MIGGGLAGCEAAWQLAERGIEVTLREMKPERRSAAHQMDGLAELVCSNSLRSDDLHNAAGLLKAEMELLGSVIMRAARRCAVPAGSALAVDRQLFSQEVTRQIERHPRIRIERGEVMRIPDGPAVMAPGPLCSDALADAIRATAGAEHLSFFDAVAPIVSAESVDMNRAFWASRYGRGSDYLNCPMDREQYAAFYTALRSAGRAEVHGFEKAALFEGCMPIEAMADRGADTMRFGPLKPAGISHPQTGETYYAVVQLRRENASGTMLNLVGFQTHLRFPEQRRVFSLIPGLEQAEFLRYGVMHRNTYLDAPRLLDRRLALRGRPDLLFAGQITGVEGYIESAATGLLAGLFLAAQLLDLPAPEFGRETALGALIGHVVNQTAADYQPMNVNFGLLSPLGERAKGRRDRNGRLSRRALAAVGAVRSASPLWEGSPPGPDGSGHAV